MRTNEGINFVFNELSRQQNLSLLGAYKTAREIIKNLSGTDLEVLELLKKLTLPWSIAQYVDSTNITNENLVDRFKLALDKVHDDNILTYVNNNKSLGIIRNTAYAISGNLVSSLNIDNNGYIIEGSRYMNENLNGFRDIFNNKLTLINRVRGVIENDSVLDIAELSALIEQDGNLAELNFRDNSITNLNMEYNSKERYLYDNFRNARNIIRFDTQKNVISVAKRTGRINWERSLKNNYFRTFILGINENSIIYGTNEDSFNLDDKLSNLGEISMRDGTERRVGNIMFDNILYNGELKIGDKMFKASLNNVEIRNEKIYLDTKKVESDFYSEKYDLKKCKSKLFCTKEEMLAHLNQVENLKVEKNAVTLKQADQGVRFKIDIGNNKEILGAVFNDKKDIIVAIRDREDDLIKIINMSSNTVLASIKNKSNLVTGLKETKDGSLIVLLDEDIGLRKKPGFGDFERLTGKVKQYEDCDNLFRDYKIIMINKYGEIKTETHKINTRFSLYLNEIGSDLTVVDSQGCKYGVVEDNNFIINKELVKEVPVYNDIFKCFRSGIERNNKTDMYFICINADEDSISALKQFIEKPDSIYKDIDNNSLMISSEIINNVHDFHGEFNCKSKAKRKNGIYSLEAAHVLSSNKGVFIMNSNLKKNDEGIKTEAVLLNSDLRLIRRYAVDSYIASKHVRVVNDCFLNYYNKAILSKEKRSLSNVELNGINGYKVDNEMIKCNTRSLEVITNDFLSTITSRSKSNEVKIRNKTYRNIEI